jgi:Thioesterase domain
MISPTRMTVLAVGMVLLAHAGSLARSLAGPAAALREDPAASATPLISPPSPGETDSQPPQPQPRAYLFRGALGPIFSRGMDRLTDRLEQAGIKASVYEFTICRLIAEMAIREYREAPAPIVLIGHSMGGLCALKFAETLQAENIQVSLVVTVDPAHASPKVPLNVERFINIFLSTSILGGGDIVAVPGYRGHYASFDLKDHDEVTHINIDKMDDVHAQLVSMVTQLARVPAKADSDPIPLRYVAAQGGGRTVGQRRPVDRAAGQNTNNAQQGRDGLPFAALVAGPGQQIVRECAARSRPTHRHSASSSAGRRDGGADLCSRRFACDADQSAMISGSV